MGRHEAVRVWRLLAFPETAHPFLTGDNAVCLHRSAVALDGPGAPLLGLEAHFHDVGGLGKRHGHGAGSAAGENPGPEAHV